MVTKVKQTVTLTEAELERVKEVAARFGCVSKAGRSAGEGSIHHLVVAIAQGDLVVCRAASLRALLGEHRKELGLEE